MRQIKLFGTSRAEYKSKMTSSGWKERAKATGHVMDTERLFYTTQKRKKLFPRIIQHPPSDRNKADWLFHFKHRA